MATEIKNTLFRFVSFRAPELTSDEDLGKRFVFRGEEITKGVFDDAITNGDQALSKWQRLKVASENFTDILSVEDLKGLNNNLYKFSIWVAKNKSNFKASDLADQIAGVSVINSTKRTSLWDNLFYQIITQKDFYAKEIIIQLLIANNVVKNYVADDLDLSKKLLTARVVLPKELFKEENNTDSTSTAKVASTTVNTSPVPSLGLMKQINTAIATEANTMYNKLLSEMKSVEKIYNKNYSEAYDLAIANQEKKVKPIIDQYNQDLEAERVKWCSTRPTTEFTYNENDPCHQPALVKEPELPEFSFSFAEPFDTAFLKDNLSNESYEVLSYLASKKYSKNSTINSRLVEVDDTLISNFEDYDNFYNILEDELTENSDVIIENTENDNNDIVSVGGILIPVEDVADLDVFEYQLTTSPFILNRVKASLRFKVPDVSWQVSHIEYTLTRTTGNYSDTQVIHKRVGNLILFPYLNLGALLMDNEAEVESITGTITFTDGCKKSFSINPFNLQESFQGYLSGDCSGELDDSETPASNEAPFIPTGFGVKQIGIADYRKVEQSVQCYVEGEVAHIENVMAREYREKSTRRLRRSENTETTSSETETEKLTDTTSTSRFEMQSEVANVIQQSTDMQSNVSYGAGVSGSYSGVNFSTNFNAGSGFATHNSSEQSVFQAVTQSKEITERALERIVSKVKQERVEKIIEEFEENNKHGFDNTKGDQHVVGVYRWVDMLYKNQVVNYGKRLMFEFMIPEPAKLHRLGMKSILNSLPVLTPPVDPRKSDTLKLEDYSNINDTTVKYWAAKYNAEIEPMPEKYISIGKSFSYTTPEVNGGEYDEPAAGNSEIDIPEGYKAIEGLALMINANENGFGGNVMIGGATKHFHAHTSDRTPLIAYFNGRSRKIPVSYSALGHHIGNINFSVKCELTQEQENKWKMETFKTIIDAYEDALADYNEQVAEQEAIAVQIKGSNPGFYRQIENTVLRKNCISYLIDQTPSAHNTYGKSNLTKFNDSFTKYEVRVNKDLDDYAALVKFMEQAFEWEIMSYNFYPFYWGNRNNWTELYQYDETNDPLFRSFMQSGMARTIVTVRPGFEEAVRHYFQTGQIWNGGEVPVIDDELYLSIVDELRSPVGLPEGKAWLTRVPTSLTILQANSIGLKVDKALPCNCDGDLDDIFEDPSQLPCDTPSNFTLETDVTLNGGDSVGTSKLVGKVTGSEGENVKVLLKNIDGSTKDFTYINTSGGWELDNIPAGKFELIIDANDDLNETEYSIVSGQKANAVELADNEVKEYNLEVKKL